MGQPYSPKGDQKQYTEKPLKVLAEQYLVGGPLPIGVSVEPVAFPEGDTSPRVVLDSGLTVIVNDTDWIISNRYTGEQTDVLSDGEFQERFGSGGGPNIDLQPT